MKTTIWILCIFLLPLVLATCHLERIDSIGNDCATVPPTAQFSVSTENCDIPCPVTIVNTSENADIFKWYFGDGDSSSLENPPAHTYTTPGTYEIVLIAENNLGCKATTRKTVVVGGTARFRVQLNISSINTTPLGLAQRNDGMYHLLYVQNTAFGSQYVGLTGDKSGAAVGIPTLSISSPQPVPYSGGFFIGGFNSSSARVGVVDANRNVLAQPQFQFNGTSNSIVKGVASTAAGRVAAVGRGTSGSTKKAGFAIYEQNGSSALNTTINLIDGHEGRAIAERPNGMFLYIGESGGAYKAFSITATGLYNSEVALTQLSSVLKVARLDGDNYAVLGYDGATPRVVGLSGSNNGTAATVSWSRTIPCEEISDMVFTSDSKIVVCGNDNGQLYYTKIPLSSTGASEWGNKTAGEPGAQIRGVSVIQAADGGFAFLAEITISGSSDLYLVKTDNLGNYQ